MNNSIPNDLSTLFGSLPQQAVDEAIEQHRLNGQAIAQCDDDGNVIIIQPEDITPLAEKIKKILRLYIKEVYLLKMNL
jgi:hypothetical protein